MKKLLSIFITALAIVAIAGCGPKESSKNTFEIAVVTDVGQLHDGGFNEGTYNGAKEYAEANNKTYKYYQPANGADATDNDRIAAMQQAIENGARVIVTPGFLQAAAITSVATENPDVKFIFVDGWALGLNNVTAISYKEEESGYLAGYAVVKDGYTNIGGTFGGGGTNAACNRFAYGYIQGAEAAAAELDVTVNARVSFLYGSSFSASAELQTQISGWYNDGVEVVFSCGGSMLQSVKSAAEETENGKIVGVDVDQASESPRVITSAVKGLTASVKKVLGEFYAGEWDTKLANQLSNLGAADDATGLPTATASWRFNSFTVTEYNTLFNNIKTGAVTIDNQTAENMNEDAAWASLVASLQHVNFRLIK